VVANSGKGGCVMQQQSKAGHAALKGCGPGNGGGWEVEGGPSR
jgi:hypothetical protein